MPQLTPTQRAQLTDALDTLGDLVDPATPLTAAQAINIRAIIAQLIEQMGPTLLQLLIAMLLNQEPNQTK